MALKKVIMKKLAQTKPAQKKQAQKKPAQNKPTQKKQAQQKPAQKKKDAKVIAKKPAQKKPAHKKQAQKKEDLKDPVTMAEEIFTKHEEALLQKARFVYPVPAHLQVRLISHCWSAMMNRWHKHGKAGLKPDQSDAIAGLGWDGYYCNA